MKLNALETFDKNKDGKERLIIYSVGVYEIFVGYKNVFFYFFFYQYLYHLR